jgi:hypothetical protein
MTEKRMDLIDIIESAGLGSVKVRVYADILPLYVSIERRSSEDDGLHACSRYIHKHIEHYKAWARYEEAVKKEGTP